jgi:hypothetical protein
MSYSTDYTTQKTMRRHLFTGIMLAVIITLAVACAYLFIRYQRVAQKPADKLTEAAQLAVELNKFVLLPSEQPTLVTVLDNAKLGDPKLMAEAQPGDSLLIYDKAQRVILYRPSARKIIDMFHVEAHPAGTQRGTDNKKQ